MWSIEGIRFIISLIGGLFYIHNRTTVPIYYPNSSTHTAHQIFNSIHNFLPLSSNSPYPYRNVYRRIPVNTTLSSSLSHSNHPIFTYSHPHIPPKPYSPNASLDTTTPSTHPNHHFPFNINVFHLIYPTLRYTHFHPFDSQLHSS